MKVLPRFISYALFEGRPVTTKGRWINPLVFSILKTVSTTKNRYKSIEKPIFILGTGRSGTTILGIVLSMHREVGYLNEPKAIWHVIYPHEDIIGNYSRGDAKYRLAAEDATGDMRQRAAQMFGAYLTVTGSNVSLISTRNLSSGSVSCGLYSLMPVLYFSHGTVGIRAIPLRIGHSDLAFKLMGKNMTGGESMTGSGNS